MWLCVDRQGASTARRRQGGWASVWVGFEGVVRCELTLIAFGWQCVTETVAGTGGRARGGAVGTPVPRGAPGPSDNAGTVHGRYGERTRDANATVPAGTYGIYCDLRTVKRTSRYFIFICRALTVKNYHISQGGFFFLGCMVEGSWRFGSPGCGKTGIEGMSCFPHDTYACPQRERAIGMTSRIAAV